MHCDECQLIRMHLHDSNISRCDWNTLQEDDCQIQLIIASLATVTPFAKEEHRKPSRIPEALIRKLEDENTVRILWKMEEHDDVGISFYRGIKMGAH